MFFDILVLIIVFVVLGCYFEVRVIGKVFEVISKLLELGVKEVMLFVDG